MSADGLSDREIRVLEAVIQVYIETAEPAGSQTIAQRFPLGVSSATIRNTMGELEEKGYLYHPHTSAGRIPTDRAYRWYVNNLAGLAPPSSEDQRMLTAELGTARSALEEILRRAAQVLGVLTNELGVAVAPASSVSEGSPGLRPTVTLSSSGISKPTSPTLSRSSSTSRRNALVSNGV